jgi:short-subunit dehydrogenase
MAKVLIDVAAQCQDVTLLIDNAGVGFDAGLISAPDLSKAKTEMEVDYFGTLIVCRAFAPVLKTNDGGAIANVLSSLAVVSFHTFNLHTRGCWLICICSPCCPCCPCSPCCQHNAI